MSKQEKENEIEARGRNGWFNPNEVSVSRYGDKLAVGVVSRRRGHSDPIYFTGPAEDMASLFRRIGEEVARLASCDSGYTDVPVKMANAENDIMKIYLVLHCHRHGVSRYLLKSGKEPTKSEVIAFLNIDYEPDREESIEIECAGTCDDIPVLPNHNKEK